MRQIRKVRERHREGEGGEGWRGVDREGGRDGEGEGGMEARGMEGEGGREGEDTGGD